MLGISQSGLMTKEHVDNSDVLISRLGMRLGIELQFDAYRRCFLLADDLCVCIVVQQERWLFYGMVESVVDYIDYKLCVSLLGLNSFQKKECGRVIYDNKNKIFMLSSYLDSPRCDENICITLDRFVRALTHICEQINHFKNSKRHF